ncbi:MAG: GlsB/YeaQ/YmgE family stress response membrane protein [Planctomycetaceae bacterium]|nr:GlsB/YeaQ/YmgE family stress response membrane protein [Planctomycetaceae bacterium]
MRIGDILIFLLVAGISGSLGQRIVGYSRGGCLVAVVLGFIGAMFGQWLATQIGLPEPFPLNIRGRTFPILWSIVGSALFVAIICLISGRKRRL